MHSSVCDFPLVLPLILFPQVPAKPLTLSEPPSVLEGIFFLYCIDYTIPVVPVFVPLPPPPGIPFPSSNPLLSSCPWVMHLSSLASPFPVLFLTSPCLFCSYQLCFLIPTPFPHSPPSPFQLITLRMISVSMILLLFWLFAEILS